MNCLPARNAIPRNRIANFRDSLDGGAHDGEDPHVKVSIAVAPKSCVRLANQGTLNEEALTLSLRKELLPPPEPDKDAFGMPLGQKLRPPCDKPVFSTAPATCDRFADQGLSNKEVSSLPLERKELRNIMGKL